MSNPINIVGTVATAPRLITTQSGVQLCTFRVASGERRFDRDKNTWIDGETNWFTVTAFRSLAQNANDSFQKGDRVIVSGRLRVRRWERDERSGTAVDIEADAVGHDLRWGTTRFTKRVAHGADGEEALPERSRWSDESEPSTHTASAAPDQGEWAPTSEQTRTSGGEPSPDGFVPAAA